MTAKKSSKYRVVAAFLPLLLSRCVIGRQDGQSDVYISGLLDRNRAFNTDVVVIAMQPRDDWKVLCILTR